MRRILSCFPDDVSARCARWSRARDRLTAPDEVHVPLARIAADLGMSNAHFIREFARVFGATPHRYRTHARLDLARRMLATGQGSVTDVCMAVGFSSPGSFSTLFSRHFAQPPSAFQRRFVQVPRSPRGVPAALVPGCLTLLYAAWTGEWQFPRSASEGPMPHFAIPTLPPAR